MAGRSSLLLRRRLRGCRAPFCASMVKREETVAQQAVSNHKSENLACFAAASQELRDLMPRPINNLGNQHTTEGTPTLRLTVHNLRHTSHQPNNATFCQMHPLWCAGRSASCARYRSLPIIDLLVWSTPALEASPDIMSHSATARKSTHANLIFQPRAFCLFLSMSLYQFPLCQCHLFSVNFLQSDPRRFAQLGLFQ
jgi:hypothetical protein